MDLKLNFMLSYWFCCMSFPDSKPRILRLSAVWAWGVNVRDSHRNGSSALELILFPMPTAWVKGVSKLSGDLSLCGADIRGLWDIYWCFLHQCIIATYTVIAVMFLMTVRLFTFPFHSPPQCMHCYTVKTGRMSLVRILCPRTLHGHWQRCKWRICCSRTTELCI